MRKLKILNADVILIKTTQMKLNTRQKQPDKLKNAFISKLSLVFVSEVST